MNFLRAATGRLRIAAWTAALSALITANAWSQPAWRPEKAVEIIVPTGAGGLNDVMARLVQKIFQDQKLVPTPVVVMNKAGGNQTLAAVYLRQHPGDPHYLLYSTSSVFTAEITGLTRQHYSDLTPIALMVVERAAISVRADLPIKTMRALIERLETDPESIAIGMVTRGGSNHLALAQAVRAAGIDPKRLKTIVFKTNVESMTALAGGHIHAVTSSVTAAWPWVQNGQARILAIAAPQRQAGPLADVPTLREQGIDVAGVTNWRGVFGSRGLTPGQSAYWEAVLAKVGAADEWVRQLEGQGLTRQSIFGRDFAKWLESEYSVSRAVLTDLGFAK